MAEDTAALLKKLNIKDANVFGWSDGGHVGIGLALKHPGLVRKLAYSGAHAEALKKFMPPKIYQHFKKFTAKQLPPYMEKAYRKVSPQPDNFYNMVEKVRDMGLTFRGFPSAKVKAMKTPTLIMAGDEDVVTIESQVKLYKSMKNARLAIIPEAGHSWPEEKPDLLIDLLTEFFDAPKERQGGGW
jgi:pimeloyl-ACP methyl ester carboxylesterase